MKKPSTLKLNHGGFTLIEVVITMAVIVILVGIALPSLSAYAKNAKVTECNRQEELAAKTLNQYFAFQGNYPDLEGVDPGEAVQLTDTQTVALVDDVRAVTGVRLTLVKYTCTYNEKTGACSLEIK